MSDEVVALEPGTRVERVVGRLTGEQPGPTVIVTAAIHGNEPSGIVAGRRVLNSLRERGVRLRGELVVIAGNLPALEERTRFLHDDLNRHWTPARIETLLRQVRHGADLSTEDLQRTELVELISTIVNRARGPIYFLDMHTSSAEGPPFLTVGDTLRNRKLALRLPLPIILGLEEQVDGSLLEFLNNYGFVTLGVEAGQHDAASSVDRHEAVLWLTLGATGSIDESEIPDAEGHRALLARHSAGVPRVLEVRRRHAIQPTDGFRMKPGFTNFDPVAKGELLAHDREGPIHAPERGRVLLPLYQGKGDDGFFLAREFSTFWLLLSRWVRRLSLSWLIHLMPGVRRHPGEAEVLVVNTRVARIYPLGFFHLFGYRKLRSFGAALVVTRRAHDRRAPAEIKLH
jgi:succinylglutamate desuccinylase